MSNLLQLRHDQDGAELPPETPQARSNPSQAKSACLEGHERWLRLVVLARVGEPQAVDEVMQEIALALVRAASIPDEPERLRAWLYKLAVRQSLLYRRSRGRQRKLVDQLATRPPAQSNAETDPLAWLVRRERGAMIRRALLKLPARESELLLLKYAENKDARALAEQLGLSLSAVESRLHRARRSLRSLLLKAGFEDI